MDKIRYPIGRYQSTKNVTPRDVTKWIDEIETFPKMLRSEVSNLTDEQLDTPYREGGWTVRQLVHHIPDSHLNAYTRFKLTLTEDKPTIKPYREDRWAELPDSSLPIDVSLKMLEAIHERWVYLLKSLNAEQLDRELIHPESDSGNIVLKSMIGLYAWHGKHHLAHITNLKKQKNWS